MTSMSPRAVVVRRASAYELLLSTHATRGQASFFLESRGQRIEPIEKQHQAIQDALNSILGAIPARWRRAEVNRDDLDRFLFEPEDLIIAVGQDGLVANIAKYLNGQPIIGVNPLPQVFDGVLAHFHVDHARERILAFDRGAKPELERRTMVRAQLDDGQSLLALNEIFIGHCTHQSARYHLKIQDTEEHHSSSGILVSTGTGGTGWARSINLTRATPTTLPQPTDPILAYFVREAFPSIATGTSLQSGLINRGESITITSEMNEGGVVFGDGIEKDHLQFTWGQNLRIGIADQTLNLVVHE